MQVQLLPVLLMKSTPYDWDALVNVDGKEMLLSELPGALVFCTQCKCDVFIPKYVKHMVKYHNWKVLKGVVK